MADNSHIEWTDATWNPITGCSRVSDGCRNCYAERMAHRFSGPGQLNEGLTQIVNGHPSWTGKIRWSEKALLDPLRWKKPRRIFVNSMSDLFHENVSDDMRECIFAVMALCPQHVFQVLTKRPERMLEYFAADGGYGRWGYIEWRARQIAKGLKSNPPIGNTLAVWGGKNLPNVWLGVSVEDQATADERIPLLLQTPAAVRFLSCEPLLGMVDLWQWLAGNRQLGVAYRNGIDWVICGGESGPGARPMRALWARRLRDQCGGAGVPFFFKQWGDWLPAMCDGAHGDGQLLNCSDQPIRAGKKAAGALLDGVEWKQWPEVKR